jgi:nucleotide-binding universal stress UspA family protein
MVVGERILVATDLAAHSDRALDRALLIAREKDAQLIVFHAIEPVLGNPHHAPAQAAMIENQLAADLGGDRERATIRVERGHPADLIEQVARQERVDLIVVGVDRVARLGRWTLGKTVERVLRRAHVPVLTVADRPREPYRKVAVATDFSQVSVETIELAASLFPTRRFELIHAYKPFTYGRTETSAAPEDYVDAAHVTYDAWLARAALAPATRDRIDVHIELGEPVRVLREAAQRGAFDLLVVGTRGHRWLYELLVGSVARRILAEVPCDALFVSFDLMPAAWVLSPRGRPRPRRSLSERSARRRFARPDPRVRRCGTAVPSRARTRV